MDAELRSLEQKISQIAALCQRLRTENSELRQELATARNESKLMGEKIESARTRLESLLERIPENEQ